jgi:XRE family transcriptional regulator, fatty acid utilization regulator
MSDNRLYAGPAVRRVRKANGLTQAQMATTLDVSPSYLTLIEQNQRPLTATLILKLAEHYDFDARTLRGATPGGGVEALRRRLADPLFADLNLDKLAIEDWIAAAPESAEAFARAFDRVQGGGAAMSEPEALAVVRREIERWYNHFADLDMQAEKLADDLRIANPDLYGAMGERLRVAHQLSIRILPVDVMPDKLHRLDLHARQLQLSEMLDPAGRSFAIAAQLAKLEAKAEVDALVAGANFAERVSERLYRRHLVNYFAAAVMMPYARFLRACEGTGYDLELLQRRFGAGFEQVAHRLTTLQRVGARGLPFFMIRIDRAWVASKRYAGASGSPLVEADGRCPLWRVHRAFDRPGTLMRQVVALEDGSVWFTLSRTVQPQGSRMAAGAAEFAIGLGLAASVAAPLASARGLDLRQGDPIGTGCSTCARTDCTQRSAPPLGRVMVFNERERGMTPFAWAEG